MPDGVPTLANARMTQMLVSPFVKQASKRLKFCCIGVYICGDCCWLWTGTGGGHLLAGYGIWFSTTRKLVMPASFLWRGCVAALY